MGPSASSCHNRGHRGPDKSTSSAGRTPFTSGHSCLSGEQQVRSREHTCGCGLSFPICEMGTGAKGSSKKIQGYGGWVGRSLARCPSVAWSAYVRA